MGARRKTYRAHRRGRPWLGLLALGLVVMIAAGIVLMRVVFVVKDIQVVGATQFSAQQVVSMTGIQLGESMFNVNEQSARRGFLSHGVLSFERLEKWMPSTVRVSVRERTPRVIISYAGLPTVLDEYGYAIAQARDLSSQGLPMVTGLRLTACEVGRQAVSQTPLQIEAMSACVQQLYAQQYVQLISELNVSDLDNLYLMTRAGMMVKLGGSEQLQQKLLWMNSALTQLTAEGAVKGILDVSSAQSAVYQPAADDQQPPQQPRAQDEIDHTVGA